MKTLVICHGAPGIPEMLADIAGRIGFDGEVVVVQKPIEAIFALAEAHKAGHATGLIVNLGEDRRGQNLALISLVEGLVKRICIMTGGAMVAEMPPEYTGSVMMAHTPILNDVKKWAKETIDWLFAEPTTQA